MNWQRLTWRQRMVMGVVLLATLCALTLMFRAAMADLVSVRARWQVGEWQSNPRARIDLGQVGWMRADFIKALSWMPGDAGALESLGYLYGVRATAARAYPELADPLLDESISYFQAAIAQRPMSPHAWASLAQALNLKTGDEAAPAMWAAWDKAWAYGQREPMVQRLLADVVFSHWQSVDTGRREAILEMVANVPPAARKQLLELAARHDLSDEVAPATPASTSSAP